MSLEDWALKWGVPFEALTALRAEMIHHSHTPVEQIGESEAAVQTRVRLEASRAGVQLWRNNVGVATAQDGSPVRYGLANDSKALNRVLKSSDLIGIKPLRVTQVMVGTIVGQFVAREVKREGWKFTGSDREQAQRQFLQVVACAGGDARFVSGVGSL